MGTHDPEVILFNCTLSDLFVMLVERLLMQRCMMNNRNLKAHLKKEREKEREKTAEDEVV